MTNERRTNRTDQKTTQQIRVSRQAARKVRVAAALLDMKPDQAIDEGLKLYAEKLRTDPKVARTLGNLGFKPDDHKNS